MQYIYRKCKSTYLSLYSILSFIISSKVVKFTDKMRYSRVILTITTTLIILLVTIKPTEATRILDEEEEQWMKTTQKLLLPSLQRRPFRPPSPNGCTWVPGGGGRPCSTTINQRNFVGRRIASPPPPPPPLAGDAYPKQMFRFGVATDSR